MFERFKEVTEKGFHRIMEDSYLVKVAQVSEKVINGDPDPFDDDS